MQYTILKVLLDEDRAPKLKCFPLIKTGNYNVYTKFYKTKWILSYLRLCKT